jgi:hypothetical protein
MGEALTGLEHVVGTILAVERNVDFDAIVHDIKRLKYELKKLLADRPWEAAAFVQNIIEEVVRTEVRKQTREQAQAADDVLEMAVVPFTGIGGLDLATEVGLLKRAIADLRIRLKSGPSCPEVTQIFVDLPDADAVRLIFKGQPPSAQ